MSMHSSMSEIFSSMVAIVDLPLFFLVLFVAAALCAWAASFALRVLWAKTRD